MPVRGLGSRPLVLASQSVKRVAVCFLLVACQRPADAGTKTPAVAAAVDEDPLDVAATLVIESLQKGDYEGLREHTVQPLTHDLSKTEFDDLAAIVQWLGPLKQRTAADTDMSHGGGQRSYQLAFEKAAALELEVSLDEAGKLIGFQFTGEGYTEAERGVLAEPWREFKVYDFVCLGPQGDPLPDGKPIQGKRVEYEIVVGGIEAVLGEHHLEIEKIVFDASGKEIFHEPIAYDAKFAADATGIPRGAVRGYLEVPGPGKWELELRIADTNAHRAIEYRHAFETTR
jgi:hypothetical protein